MNYMRSIHYWWHSFKTTSKEVQKRQAKESKSMLWK